jgi:nitrous oxidase accessory protein NosD
MGKKQVTLGLLILFLCFLVVSSVEVGVVKAEATTVYIRTDGTVEGTDSVEQNGDLYTLTGNLSGGILVQRSYIVIDGAGYTIHGNTNGSGIDLSNHSPLEPEGPHICNVTIKNVRIVNAKFGIKAVNTDNNTIVGNYIADCDTGIAISGSPNNVLVKNNTIANNINGITIHYSNGLQIITENNMINDAVASNNIIMIWAAPEPTVERNYWSDYNGTGDTPYTYIDTDHAKYTDNSPLMEPAHTIPEFTPNIIILIFLIATSMTIFLNKKIRRQSTVHPPQKK